MDKVSTFNMAEHSSEIVAPRTTHQAEELPACHHREIGIQEDAMRWWNIWTSRLHQEAAETFIALT